MSYARATSIDVNAGGDTGVTGFTNLDADLTNIFTNLNTHEALTTNAHGFTGTKTGTGAMVGATSPTLVTPTIGVATATSINGVTITASTGVLTLTAAKTLAVTNTLTLSGTDSTVMTFPSTSATIARTDAANTFTGHQTVEGVTSTGATGTGKFVFDTSPTLITPLLGTPTSGTLTNCSGYPLSSPDAIGETAPNTVRATNKEIFVTSSASSPLTAAQCSRTVVSNYGMTDADCSITLPTAAAGLLFMCILPAVRAHYFRLQSAGTDKIYLNGTAGTGPGYVGVASGYATGDCISMFTFKASDGGYDWYAAPIFGYWVAG